MRQSACSDSLARTSINCETNGCGVSPALHVQGFVTPASSLDARVNGGTVSGSNQSYVTDDELYIDGVVCPVLDRSNVTGKYDGACVVDTLSNSISEPSSSQHDSVVTAINTYTNNRLDVNCELGKHSSETSLQEVSYHLENALSHNCSEAVGSNHCFNEIDDGTVGLRQSDGKLVAFSWTLL